MLGAELEFIVVDRNGQPITLKDWLSVESPLDEVLRTHNEAITPIIKDSMWQGYRVKDKGVITLDSNAALWEIAIQPQHTLKNLMTILNQLLDYVRQTIQSRSWRIHWTDGHEFQPTQRSYSQRALPRPLYTIVREHWNEFFNRPGWHAGWGWLHHKLLSAASFQPAVSSDDLVAFLNALSLTAPFFIYEGESWYRAKLWEEMIAPNPYDKKPSPIGAPPFIDSLDMLEQKLEGQRAKVLALKGDYKHGNLVFFPNTITLGHLKNGVEGYLLISTNPLKIETVYIDKEDIANQYYWWVFWDARLRKGEEWYVEIRHLNTPSSPAQLEERYNWILNLDHYKEEIVDKLWPLRDKVNQVRQYVIENKRLPPNLEHYYKYLKKRVFHGATL